MRDFSTSADQPPMISINVFELAGEERRKLRLLMLPIGMLLKPGFRVIIDKGEPIEGKYDMCFQNACSAEIDIGAKTLDDLEEGADDERRHARSPGGDASGRELTFNIPLKDFGPAFDGKPTDPKVLEQQRQELQQQLQKRAEEQRKTLEQQQNGAARRGPERPSGACRSSGARCACRPRQNKPAVPPPSSAAETRLGATRALRDRRSDESYGRAALASFSAQQAICRERNIFRPGVRSKTSLTCGWRTGSPDSSDNRFCSET